MGHHDEHDRLKIESRGRRIWIRVRTEAAPAITLLVPPVLAWALHRWGG